MKEKLICIGGGVGPMAGVQLHIKIIENTLTDGTDQDHIPVYHFSRAHDIVDRTKYLLGEVDENPAEGMLRTAKVMEKAAFAVNKQPVIGIPCNTFHSPKIFNRFLELLKINRIDAQVINMIEQTGLYIKKHYPKLNTIGLMSTTGTRKVKVYNRFLEAFNFKLTEVPENMQAELHDSIYNTDWGIKATPVVSKKARQNFLKYAEILTNQGAELIILGCTEIPLALPETNYKEIPLIDPVVILARSFISELDKSKLIPVSY